VVGRRRGVVAYAGAKRQRYNSSAANHSAEPQENNATNRGMNRAVQQARARVIRAAAANHMQAQQRVSAKVQGERAFMARVRHERKRCVAHARARQ